MNLKSIPNCRHAFSSEFKDISNWAEFSDEITKEIQSWPSAQIVSNDLFIHILANGNFCVARDVVGACKSKYEDFSNCELNSYCINEDFIYTKDKLLDYITNNHDLAHFQWIRIISRIDVIEIYAEFASY